MSDFRAIGGVSQTLRTLLVDRMELPSDLASAPVVVGPPPSSAKDGEPRLEAAQVRVFLYRVTENGHLQNQQIPGRGSSGGYGHPPLSLNLHYLITAYGNVETQADGVALYDDTRAQFLLGSAMRVLHDVPIVTERVSTVRPPSGVSVLHESLREERERLRLCLEPLSLEDVTKVWTALALRYRLCAAYVVNVVQIESGRPARFPRPVGQPISPTVPPLPGDPPSPGPWVSVLAVQAATIADVMVRRPGEAVDQPYPYARIGDTIVLRGSGLAGPLTTVVLGGLELPASLARGDRVEAVVPDDTLSSGQVAPELRLQPGLRAVRVRVSDPRTPGTAFSSNDAAVMIVPTVGPPAPVLAAAPARRLTIAGARLVSGAGGETLLGRATVPRAAYLSATPTQLVVPIPDALPARGVQVLVSEPLGDPVAIGLGAQTLIIEIGTGAARTRSTVTGSLAPLVPRDELAAALARMIRDAQPVALAVAADARLAGTRVDLWDDRLVVVPGGLTDQVAISSPQGLTLADDLGLAGPAPAGSGSALISGALGSTPSLSAPQPRVTVRIGAGPTVTIAIPSRASLTAIAAAMQAAIRSADPAPAYSGAHAGVSGSQLLIVPGAGAGAAVAFGPAPGDDTTVAELQLRASYAVRVRVNGAESIDAVLVELPA